MYIVDNPVLLPGFCINCKSRYGGKFIQTDILVVDFGTIYLCESCFEEIHRALDFDFPNRLRNHEIRIERLEAENERLRSALALLDFVPNRGDRDFPSVAIREEDTSGTPEKRTGSKPGSAKSGAKQGSSGVRGTKLSELLGDTA